MTACHPLCALGPRTDHPGYLEYRCITADIESLPWPGEDGYEDSLPCPCGCPPDMHVGDIGCPCGLPDGPRCATWLGADSAAVEPADSPLFDALCAKLGRPALDGWAS